MNRLLRSASALACALLVASIGTARAQSAGPATVQTKPASALANLANIDLIVEEGIRSHSWPGAVVIVGHNGKVVYRKAYGLRALEPQPEPMTPTTVFDMASLTKCLSTATAIMQLHEQGRLRLDDPVAKYLPDFAANGKQDITIRQLLTHYSGLPADLDLRESWTSEAEGYRRALQSIPVTAAGVQFRYSDINFIVLGMLVEKLSGMPLNQYFTEKIAAPLALEHSAFLPSPTDRVDIAATQYDEEHHMLRGVVHDPTSRRMGGVAGHAGLFSTADDVAVFAQNLLDRLAGRPSHFPLEQQTLVKMTTPEQPATGTALRGFGWDIESPFSSNRGTIFPVGSFGHTGFTGTSLWMDPASNTYVIVLANAVHPSGPTTGVVGLRSRIADIAALSVGLTTDNAALVTRLTGYNESMTGMRRWPARNADVHLGIDVLEDQHFGPLSSLAAQHHGTLRVGLLTNQTGIDSRGRRTLDILAEDAQKAIPGLQLTTIFSPEHGITGSLDQASITSGKDTATGLPIISLYGPKDGDRRPSLDTLRKLDVVVIDLQDVGVRYYTYEAVLRYFLEAAAQTRTSIVVLDRPNPLTGSMVQGPVSDADSASYVDVAPLPVRPGLTLGELARWLNGQFNLGTPLTVVPMQGWQRGDWFDSTAITWVNPSPNLQGLTQTILYPALGLIEGTNISVGRGTSAPFEHIGAPWIDGRALASYLNHRDLAGVRFMPTTFTPAGSYPYAGELCSGIEIELTGRSELDAPELGIELAAALHKLYGDRFALAKMNTLLGNKSVLANLQQGRDPQRIAEDWQAALDSFMQQRVQYLLY